MAIIKIFMLSILLIQKILIYIKKFRNKILNICEMLDKWFFALQLCFFFVIC